MSGKTETGSRPAAQLRDFRIDQRSAPKPGENSVLGVRPATARIPQQNVRPRSSTLVESRNASRHTLSPENFWQDWNEELSEGVAPASIDLAKPIAAPAPVESPSRESVVTVPEASAKQGESWAVDLALAEIRMERYGEVDVSAPQQRHEILRNRTREFMAALFEDFRREVELFNEARRSPGQLIHVYRVSNTESDFMLFRNGVKLVVSGARAGRIAFAFNQYLGQIFGATQSPHVEIEASFGAFDQLVWTYKGERVQAEDLVRFFLSDFVRQSFR